MPDYAIVCMKIRGQRGWLQKDLAVALGVSVRTLQNWEQGHRQPSAAARAAIERIFKETTHE